MLSHRHTFVQRRFFTHRYSYKKDFCTDTFTEGGFYTQVLLKTRTHLGKRYSYMGEAGNTIWGRVQTIWESGFHPLCFYREVRLHTSASTQGVVFTQRWFDAERWFYKGMLLLTGALTQRYFQHRDACTHGCFKIQILLQRDGFAKRNF